MEQRILTLAIETLQQKKAEIKKEIAELRAQLDGARPEASMPVPKKRTLKLSPAERKRRSKRMTAYWAARRKAKTAAAKES